VSPFAVEHSQDARPMAMVGLFAALSFGALARVLAEPGARWWWALSTRSPSPPRSLTR
jgi:hypothetical protein